MRTIVHYQRQWPGPVVPYQRDIGILPLEVEGFIADRGLSLGHLIGLFKESQGIALPRVHLYQR